LFRELIKRFFVDGRGYVPIGISQWQDLAILETDGTIAQLEELADADRFDGGNRYNTGLHIMECEFDELERYLNEFWRRMGANELPSRCKKCDMNYICHGGNAGTRFDARGSFDNPGVYCSTLYRLAEVIERLLLKQGYSKRFFHPSPASEPKSLLSAGTE
jgi:radical SAM protein with 4Fe4S-binding SPASM domain